MRLQAYDLAGNVSVGPIATFQTNQSVITPGTPNQPNLSVDNQLVSVAFNLVSNGAKYVVEYKRNNWASWNRQVVTASPAQLLLESGIWSVRIGAISQSGKIVYGEEKQITIGESSDRQAPQFGSTPQAALQKTGANSFSLTWPTATDNSSWVNYSYELRLVSNNSLIVSASNIATNTINGTGSIEGGTEYRLRVIAYDKSANTALFGANITPASQPAYHDCDLNKDGLVGPAHVNNDYNALAACFLKFTNQYPECDWVDLTRDGLVDILDFGQFAYTYPNPPCHVHWP